MRSSIEAVLFDLGNTLVSYYQPVDFPPILERSISAVGDTLHAMGHNIDRKGVNERALRFNRERDDLRVWPLHERLVDIFGLKADLLAPNDLALIMERFLGPIFAVAKVDLDAVPVLTSIRALGLKSAIVSNTPWGSPAKPWRRELDRWGLLAMVDEAVFCVDAGWRKPAAEIFSHALSLLDIAPNQAVFVGDDMRWDVEGARNAGMKAILLSQTDECSGSPTIRCLKDLVPPLQTLANN